MKLETWYKLSLLLPVIVLFFAWVLMKPNLITVTYMFGMLPYIPFMLIVLLVWKYLKYNSRDMSVSIWFLPMWYAVFSPLAISLWWSLATGSVYTVYKGGAILWLIAVPLSVFLGYVYVIFVRIAIEVISRTSLVKSDSNDIQPAP